jgi:hypothetical protein
MKSELIYIYADRVVTVSESSLGHYEDALARWRFSRSIWGKLWCLLFGSACRHAEFHHGMNHACIDLEQVIGIQLKQTV